jgi:hypothetical protein
LEVHTPNARRQAGLHDPTSLAGAVIWGSVNLIAGLIQ